MSGASPPTRSATTGSAATWRRSASSTRTPSPRPNRSGRAPSTEGMPDMPAALQAVESLAEGVTPSRPALLGLTAMQATTTTRSPTWSMCRSSRWARPGPSASSDGCSGIWPVGADARHRQGADPEKILNKPEKLTDREFSIMRRHTVDGPEILRRTPEMPILAPVIAFEHHLRLDGTGYPIGAHRGALNLGTMMCAISDIFDAMRSQRNYQQAFPPTASSPCSNATTAPSSTSAWFAGSCSSSASIRRGLVRLSTARSRSCRGSTRRTRTGRGCASCSTLEGRRLNLPFERNLWEPARAGEEPDSVVSPLGSRRLRDRSLELPSGVNSAIMSEASRTLLVAALSLAAGFTWQGLRTAAMPVVVPESPRGRAASRTGRGVDPRGLRRHPTWDSRRLANTCPAPAWTSHSALGLRAGFRPRQ